MRLLRETGAADSAGELPPAADKVTKSDASPEDAKELVKLRRQLADKDKSLKERETRIAELEDENHRLKTPASPAPAKPAPAVAPKTSGGGLSSWLWD